MVLGNSECVWHWEAFYILWFLLCLTLPVGWIYAFRPPFKFRLQAQFQLLQRSDLRAILFFGRSRILSACFGGSAVAAQVGSYCPLGFRNMGRFFSASGGAKPCLLPERFLRVL